MATVLCIIIGSLAIAYFIWRYRVAKSSYTDEFNTFRGKLPNNYTRTSPMGVIVKRETKITDAQLQEIDAGIAETLRRAKRDYPNSNIPTHSDFTVWLWPTSPKCQDPSIYQVFNGGVYDGTEWDKDPAPGKTGLCYAGRMVLDGAKLGMLVSDGLIRIACQYEAEHNVFWRIDKPRYLETQDIHAHPLLYEDGEGSA